MQQSRITDLPREGLVLGHGYLNALLWERNGVVCRTRNGASAIVQIGGSGTGTTGAWRCIRAEGKVNQWSKRENVGVMAIEGRAVAPFAALKVLLSGTPGARFYINIIGKGGKEIVVTRRSDTPEKEQKFAVAVPAGNTTTGVELHVMTKDGARAEKRVPVETGTESGARAGRS